MEKRLIVDTNLLLLLVIGAVEGGIHIKNSKRLNDYDYEDYHRVLKVVSEFEAVYITPYIATEVSNLIDLTGGARELVFAFSRELFSEFNKINVVIVVILN